MFKNKLHGKTHTDELLNHGPPLQDPPSRNRVNEVMLDVIQHTPQHFQEMLPRGTTKVKLLHKIAVTVVDHY